MELQPDGHVAILPGGSAWEVDSVTLFESTRPDQILFASRRPWLMRSQGGRYQVAVTLFVNATDPSRLTGGSLLFSVTSSVLAETPEAQALQARWRATLVTSGFARAREVRFVPLQQRRGRYRLLLDRSIGVATPSEESDSFGGSHSFLVALTAKGAEVVDRCIREGAPLAAGIEVGCEYPRTMPAVRATVRAVGAALFDRFAATLCRDVEGTLYETRERIARVWDAMVGDGTIRVLRMQGGAAEPEPDGMRLDGLLAEQVLYVFWERLFVPRPDLLSGEGAGMHGVPYALRWRERVEARSIRAEVRFNGGWTWLRTSESVALAELLHMLDPSYLLRVEPERAVTAGLTVVGDPAVRQVAVSWSSSEGHAPQAPVFGPEGGTVAYLVSTKRPGDVRITCVARVAWAAPRWPLTEIRLERPLLDGGENIVLKPGALVRRHTLFLGKREGDRIVPVVLKGGDTLVANLVCEGPHLQKNLKESVSLSGEAPYVWSYPTDAVSGAAVARLSVFGSVGGALLRTPTRTLVPSDATVWILLQGDNVTILSQEGAAPESDSLIERLRAGGGEGEFETEEG